jgi:ribosome-associated protein
MIDIAQRAIERNSMIEIQIRETDEFIKLGQALKKAGLVESGVDAKFVIQDGLVKVNGETELQRGKKIHDGDLISYNGETVKVSK